MQVEIWADVVCPWCGLAHRRLAKALERFGHAGDVSVVRHSYLLDPSAPLGETRPVREVLAAKFGDAAAVTAGQEHLAALAAAEGLEPFHLADNAWGNTGPAHELLAYASAVGAGDAAWDRLYRAYFGEARSIFTTDALVGLAVEAGLDADGAAEALTSRRYAEAVVDSVEEAHSLGARGVPFTVIDRRYAVSGAQDVDALVAVLERAWADRVATPD